MPNEIGDAFVYSMPDLHDPGPGYATSINNTVAEIQERLLQRVDNGSIALMPAGTVKANISGASTNASDVTIAALKTALGIVVSPFSGAYTAVAGRGHKLRDKNFLVTDASVSPTSRISVNWAPTTDLDENTPDISDVRFAAFSVGTGNFAIKVISNDTKPISGDYKLIYQVS